VATPVNTREHQRVVLDAFVKVAGAPGGEQLFRTRDISLSGLFLFTRASQLYDFKVGQALDLELADGDRGIQVRVAIVRVVAEAAGADGDAPTGFGCKIVEMADADRVALTAFLARAPAEPTDPAPA
jgi:PilZ domain